VHGQRYRTRQAAIADLSEYIEVFYNRSRRHSTLDSRSPVQLIQDWIAVQDRKEQAA
jgi:putative transposase